MKHSASSSLGAILDCLNRGENPTPPDDADGESIVHGGLFNFGRISINSGFVNAISSADLSPEQNQVNLLRELVDAQKKLAELEPIIADAIGELREAIEKKDQETIRQKTTELSSGMAAKIVQNVAGNATLRFLGLS